MLIKAGTAMALMIKAVYVDDVLVEEDLIALDPTEGWVEVHDTVISRREGVEEFRARRFTPEGQPIRLRKRGRVRIEWKR